jgi:tetratricopeptide (TPR) repeat protein
MKTTTASIVVMVALALATPARALAASSDEEEARGFYAEGQRAFAGGHYGEAVNAYQRGYALVREPRFLYGMAQAYETLGDLPRAREYYRRFAAEAPKDDPDRGKAAAALAKIDPVGNVPPPKPYLDAGRTPEEIRAALGDDEYERYVASGLTLNGFRQRDHGNKLGAEGIVTAVASLAAGTAMILLADKNHAGYAVVGYCVAAVGTPIGFWMMRVGFSASTMANYQVRPDPKMQFSFNPRGAVGNVTLSF